MNINLTLVMQAVAFFAFILFTAEFLWPPLMRAIEARQKQIADGLAAGEEGRHSLVNAEKRIADMMTEAKTRASDIVAQGEKLRAKQSSRRAPTPRPRRIASWLRPRPRSSRRSTAPRSPCARSRRPRGRRRGKILKREVDAKAHADLLSALQKQL